MSNNLNKALAAVDSLVGKNTDFFTKGVPSAVRTGSASLDRNTSIDGWPKGEISELSGEESSGKTSLALLAISFLNSEGKKAVYIDVEGKLDSRYAMSLGVDPELTKVYTSEQTIERVFELTALCAESGVYDLIVVDSVAALTTKADQDNFDEDYVPLILSKGIKALTGRIEKTDTAVLFLNQLRYERKRISTKLDGGVDEEWDLKPYGGNALRHAYPLRVWIKNKGLINVGNTVVGKNVEFYVSKNSHGPAYTSSAGNVLNDHGFNYAQDLLVTAGHAGVVSRKGRKVVFDGACIGDDAKVACQAVRDDFELYRSIHAALMECPRVATVIPD